jgi:diacylglycerol kinase (ATP)
LDAWRFGATSNLKTPTMIYSIVNPTAGGGKAGRLLEHVSKTFANAGVVDLYCTHALGDEALLTVKALEHGATTIIAVGGDGTCTRIADAIIRSGRDCSLAVVPCGTGNDFAKTLGVSRYTVEDVAALVARGKASNMDVGHVDGHYFLNSCGFGFAASVLAATKKVRFLKGDAVYVYSALAQLLTYCGISVSVDGDESARRNMLMVTVSNGQFLGGAFRIAPCASVTDGGLDVGFFSDSNIIERVRIFAGAFRGTHYGLPSVQTSKVQTMTLEFSEPPAMEIDGELRHATTPTVKIECIPRAFSVFAAPDALV